MDPKSLFHSLTRMFGEQTAQAGAIVVTTARRRWNLHRNAGVSRVEDPARVNPWCIHGNIKENMNDCKDLRRIGCWRVSSAIGLSVLTLSGSVGQERPPSSQTVQDRSSASSGLTVRLSLGGTLEPSDSVLLKSCLAEHPATGLRVTHVGDNQFRKKHDFSGEALQMSAIGCDY